jgi:ketosteroid isomerase-like protein
MNEMSRNAVEVVREFWQLMATNDFASVGAVLGDSYVLDWPQSNERIRGRVRFAEVNRGYPANGRWVFTVHRIVGGQNEAVSEVSVTDGVQHAKAISFFTVAEGKITQQVEYWPEPYPAPPSRKHLVEAIQ